MQVQMTRRPAWGHQKYGARAALSKAAVAVAVLLLVVAAMGVYFASSSGSPKASSTRSTPSSTSTSASSSTAAPSQSSAGSATFSFNLLNTKAAIVGQDDHTWVVVLQIIHPLTTNNATVDLTAQTPAGVSVGFEPASPVALTASSTIVNVTVMISTNKTATIGNGTVTISGHSRTSSQSASFPLKVVQYRVSIYDNAFNPGALNVTAGSTVYWQNLDGPDIYCGRSFGANGLHSVVFTTIPGANSSVMQQFQVYELTFASPGSYFYYSSTDPSGSVNGTINVLSASGAVGGFSPMPTFSHFSLGAAVPAIHAAASPAGGAGGIGAPPPGRKGLELPDVSPSVVEAASSAGLALLMGFLAYAALASSHPEEKRAQGVWRRL